LFQSLSKRKLQERKKLLERLKNETTLQGQALSVLYCIPSHNVRTVLSLPACRQFTTSQLDMLFDDLGSLLSTSSVTLFSVRPPELRFVMQQNQYFRWFDRNQVDGNIETKLKYCETSMSHCFEKSAWIDGQTGHIRVRKLALPNILDYISACPPDDFEGIIYKTRLKFSSINYGVILTVCIPTTNNAIASKLLFAR